jgi:hypothetical protein
MLTQIVTIAGEIVVACELLLGAALLLLWVAIEVVGYGGLALAVLRNQRWLTLASPRPRPARDITWGATIRAAGIRRMRTVN